MRVNEWTGMVECSDCGMDLGAYPNDYDAGPDDDIFCGHCENDRHVCELPNELAHLLHQAKGWYASREWAREGLEGDSWDRRTGEFEEGAASLLERIAEYANK
ncbi:hypothetical protein AB0I84_02030 [Streptomyces spectabilis]|uniref:hypothetical protein n=1 Tax=Streptomyces spectabilis TaxID=68270 RepID=UPI0034057F48